ncbi:MAG: hypothetical protein A3C85_03140 [Candidatus Doudnabacteria bacterium RIFCSPHIGHO2_02_FULL_48_21]|uniref:Thioredoxin domain-containing protein n=1 Tax=Candidatus Doudnabacteria bacterium RIFCSPLOWO2_02_FULL_48_13 TaxID=1817845 RepID=A0A1F5QC62_9BACT|nr:MAG: hypothetical protein A3K05_00400 [Candidatus Doudnabacteria bacterium RIFCSPHIGHO2_01_48_18]OGE77718.1 MAG: hypothetical protein A2668_02910 [Candidatus Doudnabacteria bacterium RIFCSPHIGHO2_01_FULL_48_180]OGE91641.1 MAG: hypothetical protein A3F44_02970 [Candidatus Doudnabacteria bacterium RIFCSPHIGHO2_12_FULL_47_25]OGE93255.1 MAG: hypothetical protein A3C85_03140 [Candidatus Doudnabacteria bacterium RIFCSPHIGHO2_02_FULL_48_21]OGE99738.1 MAG: hypothetical protein A3J05_01900 [Candidatu
MEDSENNQQSSQNFVAKYGIPLSILLGMSIIALSIYASFGMQGGRYPAVEGVQRIDVSADDDAILGNENAPVTIIEFSDFQCPFCRKLWRETLPQLKSQYIDTGKAKFVYRDYPLSSLHPSAQKAAEAAECAGDQGKYWEMHDKMFEQQDKQGENTVEFSVADIKTWAGQIGLDKAAFDSCLDGSKYQAEVEKDASDAIAAGLTGTPGTIVNGRLLRGSQPFEAFKAVIEEELR